KPSHINFGRSLIHISSMIAEMAFTKTSGATTLHTKKIQRLLVGKGQGHGDEFLLWMYWASGMKRKRVSVEAEASNTLGKNTAPSIADEVAEEAHERAVKNLEDFANAEAENFSRTSSMIGEVLKNVYIWALRSQGMSANAKGAKPDLVRFGPYFKFLFSPSNLLLWFLKQLKDIVCRFGNEVK
ncbi:hypothetical protein ACJX0J_030877, partial [Zea mays]